MIRPHDPRHRRGYTLTIVLITLMLLFAIWSYAMRTTSGLVRIETNRVLQQARDQGAMNALARALQLLQYSKPSDSNNPSRTVFTYGITLSIQSPGGGCTTSDYTIIYTARSDLGPQRWEVQVLPGSSSVPLPNIGDTPQWP